MLLNDSCDITFPAVYTVVSSNVYKVLLNGLFSDWIFFFLQRLNYQSFAIQFNLVVLTVGITMLHLNLCASCINYIVCQAIMSREATRRLKISAQEISGSCRLENVHRTFESPMDFNPGAIRMWATWLVLNGSLWTLQSINAYKNWPATLV